MGSEGFKMVVEAMAHEEEDYEGDEEEEEEAWDAVRGGRVEGAELGGGGVCG